MSKHLFVAACAAVALAGAAMAQTPQSTPAPAPQTAPSGQAQSGASGQAGRLTLYTVQPTDMPVSNLYELDVYNPQNEKIGEIEDVIVDGNKAVKAFVLSVGGFLGIGERYVAVDAASVAITRQGDSMRAVVNTARDELRNAPAFKFEGNMRRIDD